MSQIVVLVPWLEGGGAQKALSGLLSRLPRDMTHVVVLFEGSRNYEEILARGVRVTFLDYRRTALGAVLAAQRIRPTLRGASRVLSLLRAGHVVVGMTGIANQLGGRFVASIHQMPWVDSVGTRGKIEDIFQNLALRNAVFVTSPSGTALEFLVAKGVIGERQCIVENNILPLSSKGVVPASYDLRDPLRLLFCGRLERQKGLDRLILAMREVRRPIHLVVAGTGSQELELRGLGRKLINTPHTLEFLGFVSNVSEMIDDTHLAIMPSRSELQPVFVWECWARGRAVIASAIQAFIDLSQQGPLHLFEDEQELVAMLETANSNVPPYSDDFREAVAAVRSYEVKSRLTEFLMEEG